MKDTKIMRFFGRNKKKKDFFAQFSSEFIQVLKDIWQLYRNFFHWLVSKLIISIVAFIVGLALALPFATLGVFVALIDPIPWGTFIVYQMKGFDMLPEALGYAAMHTFPFIIMTFLMIAAFIAFIFGNAYSNVLFVPLYEAYLKGEKLDFSQHIRVELVRVQYFVRIALWQLSIFIGPVITAGVLILILSVGLNLELMSFEIFSFVILPVLLMLIFTISYLLFRVLFSVILLANTSTKSIAKHSGWHYIKKSFKLTRGIGKYFKFLFVLSSIFIFTYPFTAVTDRIGEDRERLNQTIQYRALFLDNSDRAEMSRLREVAMYYENLSDQELFANYRGAQILAIVFSLLGFMLFSGLYTMVFVSFYNRILK